MTIDFKASGADPMAHKRATDFGNVQRRDEEYEAAALAVNKKVALMVIPAYCKINGFRHYNDALGATNGLQYGFEAKDGSPLDADAFATVADASSAGGGVSNFAPFLVTEDTYITVTKTGAGTATGTIGVVVDYEFIGT